MTQETTCPACGAPLVVTGPKDAIRCTFCGADLVIRDEDGEAKFRVVGQPEPQKETLSKPVEGHGDEIARLQEMDAQPLPEAERFSVPPPVQSSPRPPSFQPELSSSGAQVYTTGQDQTAAGVSSKRWLWIGGAVVLGLVLLCVCLVIVIMTLVPNFLQQ